MRLRGVLGSCLALALAVLGPAAEAGDCTGFVIGVRPLNQYNHANGNGFLAVRSGPNSGYQQIGELYLGDEFWVSERSGKWAYVGCMSGRCANPLWGPAFPEGWAYTGYMSYGGVCP